MAEHFGDDKAKNRESGCHMEQENLMHRESDATSCCKQQKQQQKQQRIWWGRRDHSSQRQRAGPVEHQRRWVVITTHVAL
jgi:hypothetical protein